MNYPPQDYFNNILLLEKLRAGDAPPCLRTDEVETKLLDWILRALGAN